MPEEAKKKQQKVRNDPKEQRRPRQRNQPGPVEKKVDKGEESKAIQKPVYEEPGPEFYKNLKKETDEILKITEEENSKYKKKEIQSNWSKYEMPIETYDEIQEQENMGADYEKLIENPSSIGGYFQFKHEKSWDVDTGPSPYDKYFEIDMDSLFLSISTIPFYERGQIDKEIFTDTDILNMNNRATRSKQKYYNDKSFSTPEMEIINSQLDLLRSNSDTEIKELNASKNNSDSLEDVNIEKSTELNITQENNKKEDIMDIVASSHKLDTAIGEINKSDNKNKEKSDELEDIDDIIILGTTPEKFEEKLKHETVNIPVSQDLPSPPSQASEIPKTAPVIESTEDLEKWLDDFLDGSPVIWCEKRRLPGKFSGSFENWYSYRF